MTNAESSQQAHVLQGINHEALTCLPLRAAGHKDVLGRQEQNDAQGPRVHLGNGDGEDQDPGEDAGQRVDDGQEREPQQQPQEGGETTLGKEEKPQRYLVCSAGGNTEGPMKSQDVGQKVSSILRGC